MLTGIGKKEILAKFGIKQIVELLVGENLRKHFFSLSLHLLSIISGSKSYTDAGCRVSFPLYFVEDHPWVPYMFEVPKEYETLDVLAEEARLGQEIQL